MVELMISQPLYQQVYENIKKSILSGKLEAGEKIIVTKLAEEFSISRTPLREALRQLENEGLLINKESGLHVIELDVQDFKELYQCRIILEKEVMRMIVHKISETQLDEVKVLLEKADEALETQDYLRLLELNTLFHEKLLESSPNKRAVELIQRTREFLLVYRAKMVRNDRSNTGINKEHRQIFEALLERSEEKVLQIVEMHLRNDEKRGLEIFQN